MEKKPYHHLPDGTFRNPEGSPVRSKDIKFSYRTTNLRENLIITSVKLKGKTCFKKKIEEAYKALSKKIS